jgi:hypothetical protein
MSHARCVLQDKYLNYSARNARELLLQFKWLSVRANVAVAGRPTHTIDRALMPRMTAMGTGTRLYYVHDPAKSRD